MKVTSHLSRRQMALVAFAMALLASVALVPWSVVAQEAKKGGAVTPASPGEKEQGKDKSLQDKLLIGTWRGGPSGGELSFQKDGTYQEFAFQSVNQHGHWKLEDNQLTLNSDAPEAPKMRGLPERRDPAATGGGVAPLVAQPVPGMGAVAPPGAGPYAPQARIFKIARLDDGFLRLSVIQDSGPIAGGGMLYSGVTVTGPVGYTPRPLPSYDEGGLGVSPATATTYFYRRDDDKSAPQQFDPNLPGDLKQLATDARLNAKEALELAAWFTDKNREVEQDNHEPLKWDVAARIMQARRGKIDFAELVGLTAAEAKAYEDLLKLAGGGWMAAYSLSEQGQLAPDELSAVAKIKKIGDQLQAISAVSASNMIQDSPDLSAKERASMEARVKLNLYLGELNSYLGATVFGN